jgi:hypothetical protein
MAESAHTTMAPPEVAVYPDDWDRADLAAVAGEFDHRHPHVAIIDAGMCDGLAGRAARRRPTATATCA